MAKVTPKTTEQDTALAVASPPQQTGGLINAPQWMQGPDDGRSLELLTQYVRPPIIKVVQKQASDELQAIFRVGDTIVIPQRILLAGWDEQAGGGVPFHIVPVFFYPEWLLVNPYEMKGQLPFIRDRSLEDKSDLALRSQRPDARHAPCPENPKYSMRYVEVLNFVVHLQGGHELAGTSLILPFAKGEHKSGTNFAGLIRMRKTSRFYGCVFECRTAGGPGRSNDMGSWKGIDVTNPTVEGIDPYVRDEQAFFAYKQAHELMRDAHDRRLLRPDYDSDVVDAVGPSDPTTEKRF